MAQGTVLEVRDLSATAETRQLLFGIDLTVGHGEVHVLMGPNGAGKSTFGQVLMGNPEYRTTSGSILLDGTDITALSPDRRSQAGLFLSFQSPIEVPGVPLASFLRAMVAQHPELDLKGRRYKERVAEVMAQLDMDPAYLERELNVGFSGGEKKKVEMLQLLLLRPRMAILDETDSGLDVDALGVVGRAIDTYRSQEDGSLLIITHNTRILERLPIDRVHVMVDGHLVAEGGPELVDDIDRGGYERFHRAVARS